MFVTKKSCFKIVSCAILLLTILSWSSCMRVKSYQKMYINDSEMTLAPKKVQQFEINFETYREGASGGNGGKVGGGCGCN